MICIYFSNTLGIVILPAINVSYAQFNCINGLHAYLGFDSSESKADPYMDRSVSRMRETESHTDSNYLYNIWIVFI